MKSFLLASALIAGSIFSNSAQAQQVYIGTFVGMTNYDTTATVGGVKLVDIGGDAPLGGIRVGILTPRRTGWFAGIEGEASVYGGRSRAVVNNDVFSYSVDQSYGAFARLGASNGNANIYFRPGVMYLNTSYGNTFAPSLGGGIEMRFSNNIAARLDVGYTWYNPSWAQDKMEGWTATFGISYYF